MKRLICLMCCCVCVGCADKELQELFPQPEYAKMSRTLSEDVLQSGPASLFEGVFCHVPTERDDLEADAIKYPSWEYSLHVANFALLGPGGMQTMMNGYGKQGWEIITVLNLPEDGGFSTYFFFFFRRPVQ